MQRAKSWDWWRTGFAAWAGLGLGLSLLAGCSASDWDPSETNDGVEVTAHRAQALLPGAIDISAPHPQNPQGVEEEAETAVLRAPIELVAFNGPDPTTHPLLPLGDYCRKANKAAYSALLRDAANGPRNWRKQRVVLPAGVDALWGDPALAYHAASQTWFYSNLASSDAQFSLAAGPGTCNLARACVGPHDGKPCTLDVDCAPGTCAKPACEGPLLGTECTTDADCAPSCAVRSQMTSPTCDGPLAGKPCSVAADCAPNPDPSQQCISGMQGAAAPGTGACIARGSLSVDAAGREDLVFELVPSRDCVHFETRDGYNRQIRQNLDGGSLAVTSNYVYAAYDDGAQYAAGERLALFRATATGAFAPVPQPDPPLPPAGGHPVVLASGDQVHVIIPSTTGVDWISLTELPQGGVQWSDLRPMWSDPDAVERYLPIGTPIRGGLTEPTDIKAARRPDGALGIVGFVEGPRVDFVYTANDPAAPGIVRLKWVGCTLAMRECSTPQWISEPNHNAFMPAVSFARVGPSAVTNPSGAWKVSYWSDLGNDASPATAGMVALRHFNLGALPTPDFANGPWWWQDRPVYQMPCPVRKGAGRREGYWGDYDGMYSAPGVDEDHPVFRRAFADSTGLEANPGGDVCSVELQSTLAGIPQHVSLAELPLVGGDSGGRDSPPTIMLGSGELGACATGSQFVAVPDPEVIDECPSGVSVRGAVVAVNGQPLPIPVPIVNQQVLAVPGTFLVEWTAVNCVGLWASMQQLFTLSVDAVQPTFTFVPPALTLTACTGANIGQALAADACTVTVTNNAPTKFPLGVTVVTWKATDQAGNFAQATQSITAVLGDDPSCCPSGTNIILGTTGNNVLVGTQGSDCVLLRAGNDTVNAYGGNDYISGGAGSDTIDSGAGNDVVFSGDGNDTIMAGTGADYVNGGAGTDTCSVPPPGPDTILSCESQ